MKIDEFVLDCVFNRISLLSGEIVYWRECVEPNEGYLILWDSGQHHHTYRHPETLYENEMI